MEQKNENYGIGMSVIGSIFFIFGFIFINLFSKFYKKQSLKALQKN